jgi:transcriptional regulator with XRE-family HTH domain
VSEPSAVSLGEIIRRQRELSRLSMRRFAGMAGISNPYLSQIERGLREPSERVVNAIARSLQTSAEALYEEAGLVPDDDPGLNAVPAAIEADPTLTPRQRRVLLDVYESFVASGPAPPVRRRRGGAPPENES